MKVLKFGGSSVAKPERIQQIVQILKNQYQGKGAFTVVFSAFGGVTDSLIEMATLASEGNVKYVVLYEQHRNRHFEAAQTLLSKDRYEQILPELASGCDDLLNILKGIFLVQEVSPRTLDYVVSFGERTSNFLIAHTLDEQGIAADYLDARKVIRTNANFGSAKVDFEVTNYQIQNHYQQVGNRLQVVTGFIGAAKGGTTTTLGRGGSDYTAAIVAAGLNADCIEIWTDVDGVLTADPRKVKKAFTVPNMTYAEAMEMSHFGAKVIYPPTLQPAFQKKIPLFIKNTFNPTFRGTFISEQLDPDGADVKGISSINHVALLTLQGSGMFGAVGVASRLFGALAQAGVNVILITQGSSESSISWAVSPFDAEKAREAVEKTFEYEIKSGLIDAVKTESDLAVVAIVGENMRYRPGIAGRLFNGLGKNGINCVAIAQGSSELNVSVVIHRSDEAKALNALHEAFFLSDTKTLHLFVVGVGLIGKTLLKQITAQTEFLRKNRSLEIKIVGLANSKKMILDESGIDIATWENALQNAEKSYDLTTFISTMKQMNLPNAIFIDNTANAQIAERYEEILEASISISTPNKIATSASYESYLKSKTAAKRRGVQFLYETNVGAGLPVLSTLRDLINSGDEIQKIEGVLSGTLSYIFNHFGKGVKFSEIVRKAQDLGYTEPDPREDLSGKDVARKILILSREIGLAVESDEVHIKPLLSDACMNATSVADFYTALEKENDHYENLRQTAENEGKTLRMIAKVVNGQNGETPTIELGLEAVAQSNPFSLLNGSDNMIVFTTARYHERPLVIRGPGAGADVTAAGIFAEIITIGNFLK